MLFVTEYPASQAALARIIAGTPPVAARFECYLDGVELANGFHELADLAEQRARFEQENALRAAAGRVTLPLDERLLCALASTKIHCRRKIFLTVVTFPDDSKEDIHSVSS